MRWLFALNIFVVVLASCVHAEDASNGVLYRIASKHYGGYHYLNLLTTREETSDIALIILREIDPNGDFIFRIADGHKNNEGVLSVTRKAKATEKYSSTFILYCFKYRYGNSFFVIGIADYQQPRENVLCPPTNNNIGPSYKPTELMLGGDASQPASTQNHDMFICLRMDIESGGILSSKIEKLAPDSLVSDFWRSGHIDCWSSLSGNKPLVSFGLDEYGKNADAWYYKCHKYYFSISDMDWVNGSPLTSTHEQYHISSVGSIVSYKITSNMFCMKKLGASEHSVICKQFPTGEDPRNRYEEVPVFEYIAKENSFKALQHDLTFKQMDITRKTLKKQEITLPRLAERFHRNILIR